MKTTISDLWNGNISCCDHCGSHDPVANELIRLIERNREKLWQDLNVDQRVLFQKYIDCADEYLLRMLEHAFCDGFSVGVNLMVESMQ